MTFQVKETQKPKLESPVLIEGLPGIGYVGRIAAKHMIAELDAKKFAIVHSDTFPPQVLIRRSGMIHAMKNEFYYHKAKKKGERDMIIILGNTQSASPKGQHALAEKILDIVEPYGVSEIYTLGGLGVGRIVEKPKVFGAVTSRKFIPKLEENGVIVKRNEVGQIIGISGILLAHSKLRGIEGICLMGETSGFYMDPLSSKAVLKVISALTNVEIDLKKLTKQAKDNEGKVAEAQKIERKIMEDIGMLQKGEPSDDQLRYIG